MLSKWANEPGITWDDLAIRLNNAGLATSEASIRRFFKKNKIEKKDDDIDPKILENSIFNRTIRELEGEQTSEDKLRDEIDSLRNQYKEAEQVIKRLREQSKIEDKILEQVTQALDKKSDVLSKPILSRPKIKGNKSKAHEFLLMVSDAHYGEVVNPEEALGIKYDTEVCRKRIEYMRDVVIRLADLRQAAYPISKITLACLGDMVGGNIHEELKNTNQITMVEQAADMAHMLYNLASDMQDYFPEVEIIVKVGNHPRTTKKPPYKQQFDNWEYMMGQMIKGMGQYGCPSLKVTVPKDMVYIHDIFDYRIAMVHGHGVKSNSFAGIPFYGLRNQREAVQALMSQTGNQRVDMFIMGHFHQYIYWSGECDIVINGAIKSGDEYGIGTRLSAPDAAQILLEWHPEHGVVSKNIIKLKDII